MNDSKNAEIDRIKESVSTIAEKTKVLLEEYLLEHKTCDDDHSSESDYSESDTESDSEYDDEDDDEQEVEEIDITDAKPKRYFRRRR